jgi:acyl carrier protein
VLLSSHLGAGFLVLGPLSSCTYARKHPSGMGKWQVSKSGVRRPPHPALACEVVPVCTSQYRPSATIPGETAWNPHPFASHGIDTSLSRSCEVSIAIDDFIGRGAQMANPTVEKAPDIKSAIWHFIVENFLFGDEPASFSDDDSFLKHAIMDSTGILEFIEYIERTFGISIDNEEMLPENLDSLSNATRFICRKLRFPNVSC